MKSPKAADHVAEVLRLGLIEGTSVRREALETLDKRSTAPTASELAADLVFDGPPTSRPIRNT
jgi:hypothetical protein